MHWAASLGLLCVLSAPPAVAQDPLSAIDWLALPAPLEVPLAGQPQRALAEPSATGDARAPDVDVVPLDEASAAGVGLLPSQVSGLPVSLWEGSDASALVRALEALPSLNAMPAAQSLALTMLLAEATPPPGQADAFLAARLDALIRRGAIPAAREVAALLPPEQPAAIVKRQADIALLDGDTTAVCTDILARPSLSVDAALRVFCAARSGAWDQAVTQLGVSHALGDISEGRYQNLLRFLDPELAETLPDLPPPSASTLSPLDYRLLVAAGAPLPTATLPLPFAVAEVSGDAGWKPRIEAAERLVRAGAMHERQLFAAYSHRAPAASGGVWDRVAAFQALDTALAGSDSSAVVAALERAWPLMQSHGLAVPLAEGIGPRLQDHTFEGTAAEMASAAMLLSRDYETLARKLPSKSADIQFSASIAAGAPSNPRDAQARAITAAWNDSQGVPAPPAPGQLGAVLFDTLLALQAGSEGNLRALTDGLRQLRALGLEDTARRTALQLRLAAPLA